MKSPSEWTRRILSGRDATPEEFARVKEIVAEIQADAIREADQVKLLMSTPSFASGTSPLAE
jgi:hypothetical protein